MTSGVYAGSFGSVDKANLLCQSAANKANLGGTWFAWLSDGFPFPCTGGPWGLLDGSFLGECGHLTGGSLKRPFDRNEYNEPITVGTALVWTGLDSYGKPTVANCGGWMPIADDEGTVGTTKAYDGSWTQSSTIPCNLKARLYCLEK